MDKEKEQINSDDRSLVSGAPAREAWSWSEPNSSDRIAYLCRGVKEEEEEEEKSGREIVKIPGE